jgi:hypothetical protein
LRAAVVSDAVQEELLEAEAIEEDTAPVEAAEDLQEPRRLPAKAQAGAVDAWRGEMRSAAIAAAGGIVAGAATVAAVRAVRGGTTRAPKRAGLRRRMDRQVVASRSFLVDVHVLGK